MQKSWARERVFIVNNRCFLSLREQSLVESRQDLWKFEQILVFMLEDISWFERFSEW